MDKHDEEKQYVFIAENHWLYSPEHRQPCRVNGSSPCRPG